MKNRYYTFRKPNIIKNIDKIIKYNIIKSFNSTLIYYNLQST
jgi:hypothetical protein